MVRLPTVGRALLLLGLLLAVGACSAVRSTYLRPGYDGRDPAAIKRIAVLGWGGAGAPAVGDVLARVTADQVKLSRNYMVHRVGSASQWTAGCEVAQGSPVIDGVLLLRALEHGVRDAEASLNVAVELYRCSDGALVWRAEGSRRSASQDDSLTDLVATYGRELGTQARLYAAPAFLLLMQLLDSLPNPSLNDAEILEKIELGDLGALPQEVACVRQP